MSKLKVGVLRGGPSPEYDVSLLSGANVLRNMPSHFCAIDIPITKEGVWHMSGVPVSPAFASRNIDVFFNALHGEYGEDGKIQHILKQLGRPHTGSNTLPSAISMAKHLSKERYYKHGLQTPTGRVIRNIDKIDKIADEITESMPSPWVVKPTNAGSSIGVSITKDYDELFTALLQAFTYSDSVLVEEYIEGREATCCVIEHSDGAPYALPAIEIIPPVKDGFFDYEVKYNGQTREICPGNFSKVEMGQIMNSAAKAHEVLELSHYSRSDFIVSSTRGVLILETNSLPGLTEESLIMKALKPVGTSFTDFLDHTINLAHTRK